MSGGLGLAVLVVALAIVLLLTERSWKMFGPAALEVSRPLPDEDALDDPNRPEDEALSGPERGIPGLREMHRGTRAHEKRLKETLEGIDRQGGSTRPADGR